MSTQTDGAQDPQTIIDGFQSAIAVVTGVAVFGLAVAVGGIAARRRALRLATAEA